MMKGHIDHMMRSCDPRGSVLLELLIQMDAILPPPRR